MPSMPGNENSGNNEDARPGLALARLAYIHGTGNEGTPLRKVSKLREIAQVHPDTLRRHMKIWDRECEEIAKTMAGNPLGFVLSEAVLADHQSDVDFFRKQTDSLKSEAERLPEIIADLEELLDRITLEPEIGPKDADKLISLFEKYLRTSANRQKVLALASNMQKRWVELSGMQGTLNSWEAGLRERTKQNARQQGNGEDGKPGPRDATPGSKLSRFNTGKES